MPTVNKLTLFEDYTISIGNFEWKYTNRWHNHDHEYFQLYSQRSLLKQLHRHLKISRLKHDNQTRMEGHWILRFREELDKSSPIGWAFFQGFGNRFFSRGLLFLETEITDTDNALHLITSLLAFIFLTSKVDRIDIGIQSFPPTLRERLEIEFPSHKVFSLPIHSNIEPELLKPQGVTLSAIDRIRCFEFANTIGVMKEIDYVRRAIIRREITEKRKVKKPKRSLIARIFRPKIDDSIF